MGERARRVAMFGVRLALVGSVAVLGSDVLAACSSSGTGSSTVAACPENWPHAATPRIGNMAIAFGALATATDELRKDIYGRDNSDEDLGSTDPNGPDYGVGELDSDLEPAANVIFIQNAASGAGLSGTGNDYETGQTTNLSTIGQDFCTTSAGLYPTSLTMSAVGALLVADIKPNLVTGVTLVTASPAVSAGS